MMELFCVFIINVSIYKTFTMYVDFLEAWMVMIYRVVYDLDNLIFKDIKEKIVYVEYLFEFLLVIGYVSDYNMG